MKENGFRIKDMEMDQIFFTMETNMLVNTKTVYRMVLESINGQMEQSIQDNLCKDLNMEKGNGKINRILTNLIHTRDNM